MGRSCLRWAAVALVAVCWTGCVKLPEDVQLTTRFASPDTEYGRLLERYTRKVELYDGFDTVASGWATWRTLALRGALGEASARAYGLKGEAAQALRKDEEDAARRAQEFHIALYTPRRAMNDLESPASLWRIFLELPGGDRLEPIRVVHLDKSDKSAVEYPYVSPWTREYSVSFPLIGSSETYDHLTLLIAGPPGQMRFEY